MLLPRLLTKGKKPSTWMSLDVGFAVGATSKTGWVGVALGIGISCGVSKCVAYGSVGTMGTVNLPTINAVPQMQARTWLACKKKDVLTMSNHVDPEVTRPLKRVKRAMPAMRP